LCRNSLPTPALRLKSWLDGWWRTLRWIAD
jgi:hypothetical protein